MSQYLYLWLDAFTLLGPLILSFDKRVQFFRSWKHLFPAIGIMMLVFIPWDIAFTVNGIWGFNSDYLSGITLWHLPIEEWLFFVVVPYACIFIYACTKEYFKDYFVSIAVEMSWIVAGGLIVLSLLFMEQAYTFYNFFGAGILTILVLITIRPKYLGFFWMSYVIGIFPFLLINGILTGSFIEDPVVWYASEENLNIQIFTIPVEDLVYMYFMLLITVVSFEKLKSRRKITK